MPGLWCVILCVVYKSLSFLGLNISRGFLFQWHSVMFGFCSIRSVVKYQHKGQFKQEPTHTQTETHSRCLRNTQPHQGRGYNRFLTWINVDMFLFPEPKLFFFFPPPKLRDGLNGNSAVSAGAASVNRPELLTDSAAKHRRRRQCQRSRIKQLDL